MIKYIKVNNISKPNAEYRSVKYIIEIHNHNGHVMYSNLETMEYNNDFDYVAGHRYYNNFNECIADCRKLVAHYPEIKCTINMIKYLRQYHYDDIARVKPSHSVIGVVYAD
jgi:hypothetical protein